MPYQSISNLPEQVRNALPEHAQQIYRKAYNSAWKEYDESDERQGNSSREATAHQVAWSAVKKAYAKNDDGEWVKKSKQ